MNAEIYFKLKQSQDLGNKEARAQAYNELRNKRVPQMESFSQRLHERNGRRESLFLSVTP